MHMCYKIRASNVLLHYRIETGREENKTPEYEIEKSENSKSKEEIGQFTRILHYFLMHLFDYFFGASECVWFWCICLINFGASV